MPGSGKTLGSVFAGLAGGSVFVLFTFVLELPLLVSLAVAGGAFAAASVALSRSSGVVDIASGALSAEFVESMIAEGKAQLATFRAKASKLPSGVARIRSENLAKLTEQILDDVRKDPKDARAAGRFLGYYLDTATKIVGYYIGISEKRVQSAQVREILSKTEKMLGTLEAAFKKHLGDLIADDLMDLDTELTLLQNTVSMDGLVDDEAAQ